MEADKTALKGSGVSCFTGKVATSSAETSHLKPGITPHGTKKLTSTPAVGTISKFPTFDASAISADASYMPVIKESIVPTGAKKKQPSRKANNSRIHNLPSRSRAGITTKTKHLKDPDQLTEEELDLLYCQYVQSLYLKSRAKKTLDLRAKDATEKLHKLWSVNQILMEEEKTLQKQLDSIRYVKQLLEYCENQKKVVQPLSDTIPRVMNEYEDLATAIESIRHKLHTYMVSVPSGPGWEEELSELAGQCEVAAQTILATLPSELVKQLQVTHILQKLVRLLETMNKEVTRCTTLLSAANSMATVEASLKLGEIQERETAS